ncbi:hypothetical protein DL96DRAFT_1455139 [Flagelloscypha sp. PMI_526]|nr:hypothetical protein DL96DRAFT_1455139 [Flagelloscypha sp. PMI_526]
MRYSPYDTSYEVDYLQAHPRRTPSSVSDTSSLSSPSNTPATPTSPLDPNARLRGSAGLPLPVPVPNLTKKSRGRRVPTVHHLEIGKGNPISSIGNTAGLTGGRRGAAKGLRMFTCKVPGCGKCFARGEHLKRHVRSIHTYEKPHKCPHPGCGKDFSRHDNLNQHMRVHRKDKSR